MYLFILVLLGCFACILFVIFCLRLADFLYFYAQSHLSFGNAVTSFIRGPGAKKQRL